MGIAGAVQATFDGLKANSSSRLVLKRIRGRYYVYREKGVWLKEKQKNKTVSEYLGRITETGTFLKKTMSARDDLENAKALIAEHGGEIVWPKIKNQEMGQYGSQMIQDPINETDLKILMALSMNSRLPISKIAKLSNIKEQYSYSRITALEKNFGIDYILELNVQKFGFTTYLILVKFEDNIPTPNELKEVLAHEYRVQFAATSRGDYDLLIYLLDENSVKAEDDLWKIMSGNTLNKYKARWYLIPFGQINSFVPLRQEFVGTITNKRQDNEIYSTFKVKYNKLKNREAILLKEMNNNASIDFAKIDSKYKLSNGAARYTYYSLVRDGTIIRPTISIKNLQMLYLGVLIVYTTDPKSVLETRDKLLFDELEYGQVTNKYALIGNISIPEGIMLFSPILEEGDLDKYIANLKRSFKGTIITSLIITNILVGSLCYRRFDNTYSRQYTSLAERGIIPYKRPVKYE